MVVKGKVVDIIFTNEENGYTVLNFETDGDFFTAVGIFPLVGVGEYMILTGEFKKNSRFGEQFVVESAEISQPNDLDGIISYLASGLFKGVGEKMAIRIVEKFGLETLEILDKYPEKLKKVSGIGQAKYLEIVESYRETKHMKDSVCFLQKYGITMSLALKIYRTFGEATVSVISNNPYILIENITGVGFATADKIAENMGIEKDSNFRIRAGIVHVLNEASNKSGHTCLPKNILIGSAIKLLDVEKERIEEVLQGLFSVKSVTVDDIEYIVTEQNYRTENAIATKLILLKKGADKWDLDVEKELKNYEKSNNINLHENQKKAIKTVFQSGVTVITGGPGTGKTTIIKAITTIAGQRNKTVTLCAPTGRASKRMTEMTGVESKTIHRLLGIDRLENQSEKNDENLLQSDVIIVDEISMADIYVFYALLKATARGTRLVLVGDKDQLPSVSCGNILSDIILSQKIDVVCLTEIYRQSEQSFIITNAHRINRGEMPLADNKYDFFVTHKEDGLDIVNTVISMLKTRIPKFANVKTSDIQVLTPVKKGIVGVENLNEKIQAELNPDGTEYVYGKSVFRVGDKVMQNCNNYCHEWRKENGESGAGVFNGDIGIVCDVGKEGLNVLFDDGKICYYSGGEMDELMLAYCISVHKSQGSEFPVVILALSNATYLLTRNLLYTAVTRAKKMVVIIGEERWIRRMVNNNFTAERYSLLTHFLQKNESKVEILWR